MGGIDEQKHRMVFLANWYFSVYWYLVQRDRGEVSGEVSCDQWCVVKNKRSPTQDHTRAGS